MKAGTLWMVAGVGTDAGKTILAAGLAAVLTEAGFECRIVKPVQTGCVAVPGGGLDAPDVAVYRDACSGVEAEALVCFAAPCSPPLAARLEGKRIAAAWLAGELRRKADAGGITLIEAAGGVLTPVDETICFADLAVAVGARVILAVDNRLGAINHCTLSLEALRNRGVEVAAIVAGRTRAQDCEGELEREIREDNIRAFRLVAPKACIVELPHIAGLSEGDPATRRIAWPRVADCLRPVAERIVFHAADAPGEAGRVRDFDRRHLWHPYAPTHPPPETWQAASASGCRIRLEDGRELIDGMSSWWAAIHGHGRVELLDALRRWAAVMPHAMFGGLTHEPAVALGERLLGMAPAGLERIFYADSGSVAVEAALKMALQYQRAVGKAGKRKFLAPLGGYHGDTLGAMSVCDPVNGMHRMFKGVVPEHIFVERFACPFEGTFAAECVAELEETFARRGGEIAAAIVEPVVQGAGGMWFYHPEYLRCLRRLCDRHGALLILDEIATGFGRTGKLFASEWAGIAPDIMCVGKALTGGVMSLAAVLCTDGIAAAISREGVFMHGPTFMANPLACAVAAASLDLLRESAWRDDVGRIEAALRRGLEPCRAADGVADVRVLGAIGVVEMARPVDLPRLQRFFVNQGVWIRPFSRLIYLMPPYVSGPAELDVLTGAVRSAVETRQWE